MTVQWIDTPNEALASFVEPIDFVATSELSCISVSFGAGHAEERAYRDGAFLSPYLASTRDGNVFALRRAGGWPRDPTVFVDEATTTAWDTLYEIDFSAQPSQQFWGYLEGPVHVARTFTIAGLTWTVFNGTASTYGQYLTHGEGLVLQASHRTWDHAVSRYSAGAYASLALDQLPGYDPLKPTAVLCRVRANSVGGGKHQAGAALLDTALWVDSNKGFGASGGVASHYESSNTNGFVQYGFPSRAGGRAVAPGAIDRIIGVVKEDGIFGHGVASKGVWTGSFPDVEQLELTVSGLSLVNSTAPMEAAFISGSSNTNEASRFYTCSHMRVLQKAVT